MSDKSTAIGLTEIPKDKDYEDYICAYMQAGGLYVERSIIFREVEELLELDILTTNFQQNNAENNLIEIKGWLAYLNYPSGTFIVQKIRPSISYFRDKAKELNIDLIDNSDLTKTEETLNHFFKINPKKEDVQTIRFAYLLERKKLQQIKILKKKNPEIESYSKLDDYFFKVNCGSFFSRNPINRINQLFNIFIKYKNITAKVCHELETGSFDNDITELSQKSYIDLFYKANDSILQVSLYIEHLARITILKCAIEHLIDKLEGNYQEQDLVSKLDYLTLPNSIKKGLSEIITDKYFYLYPGFWQFFTYVFGGFILTDIEDKEFQLLSDRTGIPVDEIPNAFDAFNKLFPRTGGWFYKFPKSSIKWHYFFPIVFSGLGANYRRIVYTDESDYSELFKILSGDMTSADLIKWNNLAYSILK